MRDGGGVERKGVGRNFDRGGLAGDAQLDRQSVDLAGKHFNAVDLGALEARRVDLDLVSVQRKIVERELARAG